MAISSPSKCFACNHYYLKFWKQRVCGRDAFPIILIIFTEAICAGLSFYRAIYCKGIQPLLLLLCCVMTADLILTSSTTASLVVWVSPDNSSQLRVLSLHSNCCYQQEYLIVLTIKIWQLHYSWFYRANKNNMAWLC